MNNRGVKTLLVLLGLLAIGQVIWWGYSIIERQETITELLSTPQAMRDLSQVKLMILSEGAVFLLILGLGAFFTYKFFRNEMELKSAQNDFLAAITHELKTPITNVQLCLETLERPELDEEKRAKYIHRAKKATTNLLSQVQQVLEITRKRPNDLKGESTSLRAIINSAVVALSDFEAERNLRIDVPEDLHVTTSPAEAKLVIQSLLENALKYTQPKYVGDSHTPEVFVSSQIENEKVHLKIRDNGMGISQDEVPHIFEPFWRSPASKQKAVPGTGLGLTLTKTLGQRLKLDISVSSKGRLQGTEAEVIFSRGSLS